MGSAANAALLLSQMNKPDERRRYGRLKVLSLRCEMGRVSELSAGGLLVDRRGLRRVAEGTRATLVLSHRGGSMTVPVRVVRSEPSGWLRRRYGLEILDDDPGTRAELSRLAQRVRRPAKPH